MTSKTLDITRRHLTLAGGSALLLSACGGGGSSSAPASVDDGTPDYGGRNVPGLTTMTVTDKVVMTVTMPDISGVASFQALTLDEFNALPLATRKINVGLDRTHAPLSVANFLAYVDSGAYANTIFHRVINGFVAQGGGYTVASDGTQTHIAEKAAIALESRNGLSNTLGTIAMARQTDPNTATSEFYFNTVNNGNVFGTDSTTGQRTLLVAGQLDYQSADQPGYAVFGIVLDAASLAVLADMNTIASRASDANGLPLRAYTLTAVARA